MCVRALQVTVYLNTMHFWSKSEWKSCIFFIPYFAVEFISVLQIPHKNMFQVPRPLSAADFQNAYSMIEQRVFITLGGLSDPGYSRWSSLFQRCISFMTIGLLKSTNWNPVTLAPPCMNLSKDMSLKPWVDQKHDRNKEMCLEQCNTKTTKTFRPDDVMQSIFILWNIQGNNHLISVKKAHFTNYTFIAWDILI